MLFGRARTGRLKGLTDINCSAQGDEQTEPRISLRPPRRLMKLRNGSSRSLYSAAYRNTRDHLLRVRSPTVSGSAVQRITAANGSGSLTELCPRRCRADKRA